MMANNSNKLLVPGIEQYLDQVKYEIAQEFGVQLGSDTVSRANGSVGGNHQKISPTSTSSIIRAK